MAVGGDPEAIRMLARGLRTQAGDVGHTAGRVRSGQGIEWVGLAADRYRERLRERARDIDETREAVLAAAGRLDELADTLEDRQRAIARAAAEVEDALDGARRTVTRFAGAVWDDLSGAEQSAERGARRLLDTVRELPAPGHPDWIDLARRLR
jgi:ABC-type transporter Mla subunit MlaD